MTTTQPDSPVTKRFADFKGWAALVSVLLVSLGTAVLALIAQHTGNGAVNCINGVLAARSPLTVQSAAAQKSFADADETYNAAVNRILLQLTSPGVTAQQIQAQLSQASATKDAASKAYSTAMSHIYAVAKANPLGHC